MSEISVTSDESGFAALEPEWDELVSEVGASPFMRPGWIGAWWRAFGSGTLHVLVLRRGGTLAGVLPLSKRRGALASTTNWHTPEFAPIAADDEAVEALLEAALQRTKLRLDLSFLPERSAGASTCLRLAQAAGFGLIDREVQRSPYIEITEWESFQASLPSRRLSKYRRFRRRLDERGNVVFHVSMGGERLNATLAEGFAVEAGSSGEGTAILARPETERFYTDVAEWAAERGWLRLWFLRLDDAPIAFAYGLEWDGIYFDLKVGFDPDYGRFGPGVLLMEERIRHAFETGLKRFEFLGDPERHKLDWMDDLWVRRRVQMFAPTVAGALNRIAWQRGRPALIRARRGFERKAGPRD